MVVRFYVVCCFVFNPGALVANFQWLDFVQQISIFYLESSMFACSIANTTVERLSEFTSTWQALFKLAYNINEFINKLTCMLVKEWSSVCAIYARFVNLHTKWFHFEPRATTYRVKQNELDVCVNSKMITYYLYHVSLKFFISTFASIMNLLHFFLTLSTSLESPCGNFNPMFEVIVFHALFFAL